MSQEVRACGRRGFVVWCPFCKSWEPVGIERKKQHPVDAEKPTVTGPEDTVFKIGGVWCSVERGAFCGTCNLRLEEVRPYPPSSPPAPKEDDGGA